MMFFEMGGGAVFDLIVLFLFSYFHIKNFVKIQKEGDEAKPCVQQSAGESDRCARCEGFDGRVQREQVDVRM